MYIHRLKILIMFGHNLLVIRIQQVDDIFTINKEIHSFVMSTFHIKNDANLMLFSHP